MPREVARVGATAIIWCASATIFAFLLIGKSLGPFEMVLGIIIAGAGLVSTAAVWEQLNDSPVHLHLADGQNTSTLSHKRKGRLQEDALRRLVDSLDDAAAAELLLALQERERADGEFPSLRRLMDS